MLTIYGKLIYDTVKYINGLKSCYWSKKKEFAYCGGF